MGNALKGLLGSKKYLFSAFTVAALIVARKLEVELTMQEIIAIVGLVSATNIAQGIADAGKEKAKVHVEGERAALAREAK